MKKMKFTEILSKSYSEDYYPRSFIKNVETQDNIVTVKILKLGVDGSVEFEGGIEETYETSSQAINRSNEIKAFRDGTDSLEEKEISMLKFQYKDEPVNMINRSGFYMLLMFPFFSWIYIGIFFLSFFSDSVDEFWIMYKYSGLLIITIWLYIL
ncbi:MAG: hypothetical protein U9O86_07305, partial [Campylobacterota bacterium]|nr:hypothetical protein [Campylobacterota bacterium]